MTQNKSRRSIMGKTVLPHKLSDLLEIAVDDAQALQTVPGVTLNMSTWLLNKPEEKSCSVCMAGAVMLRRNLVSTKVPRTTQYFFPADCGGNHNALIAINYMRTGAFFMAASFIGVDLSHVSFEVKEISQRVSRSYDAAAVGQGRAPWSVYRCAIQELRKLGL